MTYPVKIADRKVWVGDTPLALLSGEIHYWRLAPEIWQTALRRIKEMGLSMVATYICWDFHEIAPGQYDFSGATDPRRNLIAFLELVAAENLWLIIRPGPYIYSEWRNRGVPDHTAVHHRLSAEFQAKALNYMQAVVPLLIPHLASRGGRIVLLQADNEVDVWPQWYGESVGLGNTTGIFHTFLRERYGAIEALNRAWGTAYAAFDAARAISIPLDSSPEQQRRGRDTQRFRVWYANQVARWSVDAYRTLGVDVPIVLNTYSGIGAQSFADFEQIGDLVGADFYASQEFALRPGEYRSFMDSVRILSAYSRLPYIAEFGAGIWHDWLAEVGILTPNHYRLVCLSALLSGIVGWNWYMLVNRDNWAMAPINEQGRTHPDLFAVFQQITTLFNTIDPPTLTRQVTSALTFDSLTAASGLPTRELLKAFLEAGIDHDFCDLSVGACAAPLLFLADSTPLSNTAGERLIEYVQRGGHLTCLGGQRLTLENAPEADPKIASEALETDPNNDGKAASGNFFDRLVPDQMQFAGVVDSSGSNLRVTFGTVGPAYTVHSPWLAYLATDESIDGQPIHAERVALDTFSSEEDRLRIGLQVGIRYTIGATRAVGSGHITVIGLPPSADLLIALHAELLRDQPDAQPMVRTATPDTAAAWFTGQDAGRPVAYLIVTNNGEEAKAVELHLRRSGRYQASDLLRGGTFAIDSDSAFYLPLPRKDGTVLRLIPQP